MKKIAKYTATTIMVLIMLMGLFVLIGLLLGWRINTVASGSMDPALRVGETIMTRPVEPETINTGDIIVFSSPMHDKLVCHRVVGVEEENSSLYFQTKGDANEESDPWLVPAQNVVSRVQFHTPLLSYISSCVKSPLGFILFMGVPGLIVIGMEIKTISRVIARKRNPSKVMAQKTLRGGELWGIGLRRDDWLTD